MAHVVLSVLGLRSLNYIMVITLHWVSGTQTRCVQDLALAQTEARIISTN